MSDLKKRDRRSRPDRFPAVIAPQDYLEDKEWKASQPQSRRDRHVEKCSSSTTLWTFVASDSQTAKKVTFGRLFIGRIRLFSTVL
jgi:hypothetical protein